jgi:hypothetical protein
MTNRWLEQLQRDVQAGHAADLAGTRITADVALSDGLLNQIIADALRPEGLLREVTVRTDPAKARVSVKLTKPSFLPAMTVTLTVDRQPELPASPVLVLRVSMPPGVAAMLGAGMNVMQALPAGLRLDGDLLSIDVRTMLNERGYGWLSPYLRALNVALDAGRLIVSIEAKF